MTARRAFEAAPEEPLPEEPAPPGFPPARRALAPRPVPVGRRWVPRTALTPSRALPDEAPPDVSSDVIVWSHSRDAVGLAALFLVSFTVTRIVSGRGADVLPWLAVSLVAVSLTLGLFLLRRHRVEADAEGVRQLGVGGWRLAWDEIAEVRLDGTRDAAGRAGWFRLGARATSVALEVVPGPGASRRTEGHAALRSDRARALGELARYHGVATKEALGNVPRRVAS
nr:hypothetical protein [Propionibacterium sp.]